MKEVAGVSNTHSGRYAAFPSERSGVLKNRALLHDESGDAGEQRGKMWMQNAHNENRTCRNTHNIFGVTDNICLSAGTSWRGAQARIDFRRVCSAHEFLIIVVSRPGAMPRTDRYS